MESSSENSAAFRILISSNQFPEPAPVTASIKTIPKLDLKWEQISARLIEKVANIRYASSSGLKAPFASVQCQICWRTSRSTKKCFCNPLNSDNKLQLPNGTVQQILTSAKRKHEKRISRITPKHQQSESGIYAMGRAKSQQNDQKSDRVLKHSGLTSHMTSFLTKYHSQDYGTLLLPSQMIWVWTPQSAVPVRWCALEPKGPQSFICRRHSLSQTWAEVFCPFWHWQRKINQWYL